MIINPGLTRDDLPWHVLFPTGADSSDALEAALQSRRNVVVMPGVYRISRTVQSAASNPSSGIRFVGSGRSLSDVLVSTRSGESTVFVWDGPVGGTMIEWLSPAGMVIESMSFVGKSGDVATNTAGILIHHRPIAGFGNSGHSYRSVDFQHATCGIQIMSLETDTNGDTSDFTHVYFLKCETGLRVKNHQGICWNFNSLYATECKRVLDFENGGKFSISMAVLNACGDSSNGDYCFHVQNSQASAHTGEIRQLHVESGTNGVLSVNGTGKFIISGYNEAQLTQNARMFSVIGALLSFESSKFDCYSAITKPFYISRHVGGGFRPAVAFRNCGFASRQTLNVDEWFEVEPNTPMALTFDGCTSDVINRLVPNFATQPELGVVYLNAKTVGAVTAYGLLTGAGSTARNTAIVVATNTAQWFDVTIVAKEPGAAAAALFNRRALIVNDGGTVTISSIQTVGTDINSIGLTVDLAVVSDLFRTVLTGAAGKTIYWTCMVKSSIVAT